MFHTVLVCSDGSEHAMKAVQAATEVARKFHSQIVLLTVFTPTAVPIPFVGVPEAMLWTESSIGCYADELQTAVEKQAAAVLDAAPHRYKCRREIGHPVDRIVAVAQDIKADLIVLGSRGLGGWNSYLLGSVSDGVLHHAHCPVLIVR